MPTMKPILHRLGLTSAALSVLLFAGLSVAPQSASADVCQDDAIAFGFNDSDNESCSTGDIFTNDATAENTSSPWSAGYAWARAETDNASIERPTYAWSFNTNTTLGAAGSVNDVFVRNVPGTTFGPSSSAYAIATNDDSSAVAAGAWNQVNVDGVTANYPVFAGDIRSEAANTRCNVCEAGAKNIVDFTDVTSTNDLVSLGIYANAFNTDAEHSTAIALNAIKITGSDNSGVFLFGDSESNGSYALAQNSGGPAQECIDCHALAYNSLDIDNVTSDTDGFLTVVRAVGLNDYSSGSSALAVNKAVFTNISVGPSVYGVSGEIFAYAYNVEAPDSEATSKNSVVFQGPDLEELQVQQIGFEVGSISDGSLYAFAQNYYCDTCKADAVNDLFVSGAIQTPGSIFGGGAYAHAFNEGPLPPGFSENTAIAGNTVRIEGVVSAGVVTEASVGTQTVDGDIITNSVYSYAHNYVGDQNEIYGSCYECVAVADNFLKIADSSSGGSLVATDVYATAENYNSDEVLAKANNKVIIKDSSAGYSIITDPDEYTGSVFAYSTNRYCYECEAKSDNFVLIDDSHADDGIVLNGHAYAWAENNLDGNVMYTAEAEEEAGSNNTAVAYNTLIIADNTIAGTTALGATGNIVNANVYSCASNNVGGGACGEERRTCVTEIICEESAPSAQLYEGDCTNCNAYAYNYVKVTGDSTAGTNESGVIGIFAHAENTAQGNQGGGACDTCFAGAVNVVNAENGSNVNEPTTSMAINTNSENVAAGAVNVLKLDDSSGSAEARATNTNADDSAAFAGNLTTAENGSTVESFVGASNTNTFDAATIALGGANATNGGTATNDVKATNDGGGSGVTIAAGTVNANGTTASGTSTADLTNDGTSSGMAVSVSYDATGNVAVAVVVTDNGDGVAVAYTNATNTDATAEATADGSATQGGDVSFQTGDPTTSTSVGP